MKKRFIIILGLLAIIFTPNIVNAEGDNYFQTEGHDHVVDHSLFTAGNVINSKETVNGLNFVAGDSISINGENEYGFYAGNNIAISNKVVKDVFVAGNTINITDEANIGRDLYAAGSVLTINGNIANNAFVAGDAITLKDVTIDGNLNIACSKVIVEGVVSINGTMNINENAIIENENNLMVNNKNVYKTTENYNFSISNLFVDLLISIASIMLLGFIINGMFPKVFENILKDLSINKVFKNIGIGLLVLIVVPIASIILLCTIVGIRLGFVLGLVYILMLLLAILFAAVLVGELMLTKLFKGESNTYLSIAIGIIVLKVVGLIPVVGTLAYFLSFLYGIGKIIDLYKINK